MKLELKHLAPYLPYGLKVKLLRKEYEGLYSEFSFRPYLDYPLGIKINNDTIYAAMLSEIKPILRPLSDLTKEIEHNGEKFVPMFELLKMAVDEKDYNEGSFNSEILHSFNVLNGFAAEAFYTDCRFVIRYYNDNMSFSLFEPQGVDLHCGFRYIERLFEWHFDVFGLIYAGLAIDINTLK